MSEKTYAMKILDILSSDNDRKQKYTQLGRVVVEEISGAHTQGRKEALEEVKEKIEKVNREINKLLGEVR